MQLTQHRKLHLVLVGTFALYTAQASLAASTPAPIPFERYDQNGDKQLSLEEFTALGGQERAFKAGDTNQDGKLSEDEFAKTPAPPSGDKASKYISDALITTKVKTLLFKEESVKGLDVSVETHQGTVQLSGWVATPAQIVDAGRLAASIEGVKAVRNELQLKRPG